MSGRGKGFLFTKRGKEEEISQWTVEIGQLKGMGYSEELSIRALSSTKVNREISVDRAEEWLSDEKNVENFIKIKKRKLGALLFECKFGDICNIGYREKPELFYLDKLRETLDKKFRAKEMNDALPKELWVDDYSPAELMIIDVIKRRGKISNYHFRKFISEFTFDNFDICDYEGDEDEEDEMNECEEEEEEEEEEECNSNNNNNNNDNGETNSNKINILDIENLEYKTRTAEEIEENRKLKQNLDISAFDGDFISYLYRLGRGKLYWSLIVYVVKQLGMESELPEHPIRHGDFVILQDYRGVGTYFFFQVERRKNGIVVNDFELVRASLEYGYAVPPDFSDAPTDFFKNTLPPHNEFVLIDPNYFYSSPVSLNSHIVNAEIEARKVKPKYNSVDEDWGQPIDPKIFPYHHLFMIIDGKYNWNRSCYFETIYSQYSINTYFYRYHLTVQRSAIRCYSILRRLFANQLPNPFPSLPNEIIWLIVSILFPIPLIIPEPICSLN